ncbi:spermatid maturation protein 1 [Tenrec ecaudatus]|uniref:spermatid maturation protein 1 n=1 Tax=Tenrec ecaudatus TaxID=94439 RepID=UPI003F59B078
MAIAEQPPPEWASYHSPTNSCQDLGNSILLLLGLIICINIGINMVTLLWRRLRGFLHQAFHYICVKEALKSSTSGKQTTHQPSRKKSSPPVHLRCTMDPVKMSVTPPPARRHRRRDAAMHRAHHLADWCPDTDEDDKHPAICSHHWDCPDHWEGFQATQGAWDPWAQDAMGPPAQTIRFQQTVSERPLKTEVRSEMDLEAYVYSVNPPPPSHEALNHNNSGVAAEDAACSPAPPPVLGPAIVPDIPRRRSSFRVSYDARDVRRRLRELTREVEALSHCYPMPSRSNTNEGTSQAWVYRPLAGR